jgi:hypothetical protein
MKKDMTLLDYFAGQALIATYKNSVDLYNEGGLGEDPQLEKIYEDAAETAYLVAQEMMKQKAKYDSEQSS